MSWYCDRCGKEQKDNLLGGIISQGDMKHNSKNSSIMKENNISSLDNICNDCYNYLFYFDSFRKIQRRIEEDKKWDQGSEEDGLSSRFAEKSYEFDLENELIDPRTKIYKDETFDEVLECACKSYNDTAYLYNCDYAVEDEECARCGIQIKKGEEVYTSRIRSYLDDHYIYDDICYACYHYLSLDGYLKKYRKSIDLDFEKDSKSGLSSRYYPKCKEFDIKYDLVNPKNLCYSDEKGFDDIIFSDNASIILQKELFSKSTCASYKSLITDVNNNYTTKFASDFQTYITRLGLIINKIVINRNYHGEKYYPGLLKYICFDIINNELIYKNLKKINTLANSVKHSLDDIDINIKDVLIYYNSMIDKLINISNCPEFQKCHIYSNKPKKKEKIIKCSLCGRMEPDKYYCCPHCNKIVCDDCYNREKRMCIDCASKN